MFPDMEVIRDMQSTIDACIRLGVERISALPMAGEAGSDKSGETGEVSTAQFSNSE